MSQKTLRSRIVAQFGRPTGIPGWLVGWVLALRPSNRERNRRTVELLQIRETDRILEVGFGPGLAIEAATKLAQRGVVVGIDHSDIMLNRASQRNAAAIAAGRVELHLASAEALPRFTEPFDKLMAVNVHLVPEHTIGVLRRWLAVMRPGAVIAITYQSRKRGATDADSASGAQRIASHLRAAGFVDIKIETLEMKPVNAACVLARRPNP